MKIIELIKEKLIGLGFVLDDKTVELKKTDFYSYNKEVGIFIILGYYLVAGYLNQFSNQEITLYIESFLSFLINAMG